MTFIHKTLKIRTKGFVDIHDITPEVREFVEHIDCTNGYVNVFTRHTTAVIKINEQEDGLWQDLKNWIKSHIPADYPYHHNDLEHRDPKTMCDSKVECLNGHSHIASMMFGTSSEHIPVIDGNIQLGTWQRFLLIEMDHARDREIILSFMGE